jgi:hypothetical protein
MRAGFARACINPPLGTRMMGFGSRDRDHGCAGIHDDIFVRALYLEQGGQAALIMGFDLCFVGRVETAQFKAAIAGRIDLSPGQVLMNASHSHVGPAVGTWYYPDYSDLDRRYIGELEAAVVAAATEAQAQAREVTLWAATTRSALPVNRRRKQDGSVIMAPNPEGFVFDDLPICLLRDREGHPVCLLFSVSCHPSMMSGFEISAEYPGAAMNRLDAHLGAAVSLFLQGVGGDAKPSVIGEDTDRWRAGTWDEMGRAGGMVADEVIAALEAALTEVEPDLRSMSIELQWPMEPPLSQDEYAAIAEDADQPEVRRLWARQMADRLQREGELPGAVTLALQGIRVGDGLRIVALEGEPVAPYGKLIRDFYSGGVTFPLGYSNGEGLYLPTSEMLDEGGYEVVSYWEYGQPARLAKGFEGTLTDGLRRLGTAGVR